MPQCVRCCVQRIKPLQAVPASRSRWTNRGVTTSVSEQNESKLAQNLNSLVEEPPEGMARLHPQLNLLSFLRFLFLFLFSFGLVNHFPTLHHSLTSSSFAADSDLLMSCEVKGNDDEFDPIPVLISKNPSQGKVNPSPPDERSRLPKPPQQKRQLADRLPRALSWCEQACAAALGTLKAVLSSPSCPISHCPLPVSSGFPP